jgi:hypothetical protein
MKHAYLTFDDGPYPSTASVLDVLRALQVKATFFLNGKHMELRPAEQAALAHDNHWPLSRSRLLTAVMSKLNSELHLETLARLPKGHPSIEHAP